MENHVINRLPKVVYATLKLVYKKEMEYKINFFFDFLLRIGDLGVYLLLWTTIFSKSTTIIPGWTFQEMILLFAFQAIAIVFMTSFSYSALYMNEQIIQGKLDSYLARPTISWLSMWMASVGIQITGLLTGIAAMIYLMLNGYYLNPIQLLLIIPMILLGALITTIFALLLVSLTFWLGRLRGLDIFFDGFWGFGDYPTTIFSPIIRIAIAFTMPFLFIHTVPIQWIIAQINTSQFLLFLLIEIGIVWVLLTIFYLLWKKGLKRYESFGG